MGGRRGASEEGDKVIRMKWKRNNKGAAKKGLGNTALAWLLGLVAAAVYVGFLLLHR